MPYVADKLQKLSFLARQKLCAYQGSLNTFYAIKPYGAIPDTLD